MLEYKEITCDDIESMTEMYIESFNAPPWNEKWTTETVTKRLHQMIHVEDFYGLCVYEDGELCGMILGLMEQYYDGRIFQIREFCTKNSKRGQGLGSRIYQEFERRMKAMGIKQLNLLTSKGAFTEHFYEKQGFSSGGNMIFMEKELKLCYNVNS